jgi:4-hydroxythreonine-4-phosphate dehydrogenase
MAKPLIGVTMGDPAGIGPEICAKAVTAPGIQGVINCVVIGDRKVMKEALKHARLGNVSINPIKNPQDGKFTRGVIDVLDLNNVTISSLKLGQVAKASGKASVEYVEKAIRLALDGRIDGLATGPISKEAINKAGYKFQGHTELLAARTKCDNCAMMFVSDTLWVMLVTTHIPLKEVSGQLTKGRILKVIKLAHETLLRIKGSKPKIGVAGLNPHAGESGLFGDEEEKTIKPAIAEARKLGINVKGPVSPDTIFHFAQLGLYDIVVAMYHDQGLIPVKLLSFNHSVNVTIGLPIIRTSVDHGTGFDIVGQGLGNAQSLIEAIKVAAHISRATR